MRQGLRSLRDLTQHLTTRDDDSHAPPAHTPQGNNHLSMRPVHVKPKEGSSRCIELIHMLRRLCGPPSIPLSFSLAAVLPRRIAYRVSYGTAGLGTGYTKQSSFRARTTRVSNPVCSPSFRASASVMVQCAAFATGVPPDIYAFHRYTGNSTHLSHTPAQQFRLQAPS